MVFATRHAGEEYLASLRRMMRGKTEILFGETTINTSSRGETPQGLLGHCFLFDHHFQVRGHVLMQLYRYGVFP
jgi:hypothetical protein